MFKNFLFNLPRAVNSVKNSKFEALNNISFEVYKGETFMGSLAEMELSRVPHWGLLQVY